MPLPTLRIIDANCNRISEGLRFLEDIARFLLNDVALSRQLKTMRHNLIKSLSSLEINLLSERDSDRDVGSDIKSASQQRDLPALVMANARRAEEGLRVIEELAKLPEISPLLHSKDFEQARFTLYTLEQSLLSKVLRQDKVARLTGLYVIIDTGTLELKNEVDAATKVIRGGARTIQLRDKQHAKSELRALALKLRELCHKSGTLFIVNDHLDIALAVDADGLHIGQTDLPLSTIRRELPIDKIIGCSVATLPQALRAKNGGADYVAVGSIFPSPTKKKAATIGIAGLSQIRQAIPIPLVAIGGINKDNVSEVMAAGATSAAVISAVLTKDNIEQATQDLVTEIGQEAKS